MWCVSQVIDAYMASDASLEPEKDRSHTHFVRLRADTASMRSRIVPQKARQQARSERDFSVPYAPLPPPETQPS
jgi:hypothetical protein